MNRDSNIYTDSEPVIIPTFGGTDQFTSNGSDANQIDEANNHKDNQAQLDFGDIYRLGEKIGSGVSATVYKCRHIESQIEYAVKVIDIRPLRFRPNFDHSRMMTEVRILKMINHENIIRLVETFIEKDETLFLVMEYAPGKELFDSILAQPKGHYSEEDAKPIFIQMAKALEYLHSMNIIHRDIKPENVLVVGDSSTAPTVKLLDFGLSKQVENELSLAKTFVGTPCYLAPEVEKSKYSRVPYGREVDYWSLGAVLYVMLVARFPEFASDQEHSQKVLFRQELWGEISPDCKALIAGLMEENPTRRITAEEALAHPWLSGHSMCTQSSMEMERVPSSSKQIMVLSNMQIVGGQNSQCDEESKEDVEGAGISDSRAHRTWASMMESEESYDVASDSRQNSSVLDRSTKSGKRTASDIDGNADNTNPPEPDGPSLPQVPNKNGQPPNTSQSPGPIVTTPSQMQIIPAPPQRLPLPDENETCLAMYTGVGPLIQLQQDVSNLFKDILQEYIDNPQLAPKLRQGALLCRERMRENNSLLIKIDRIASEVLHIFSDLQLAAEENEPELAQSFFSSVRKWVGELSESITTAQTSQKESTKNVHDLMEEIVHFGLNRPNIPEVRGVSEEGKSNQNLETMMSVCEETVKVASEVKDNCEPTVKAQEHADELLDLFLPNLQTIQQSLSQSQTIQNNQRTQALLESEALTKQNEDNHLRQTIYMMLIQLNRVDHALDNLAVFWGNTKVILDLLLVKAEHVENFIKFVSKPRLLERFLERLHEYETFWKGIQMMCRKHLLQGPTTTAYSFLESMPSQSRDR